MINCPKGHLYPVLFGVVVALASVLVVTVVSQPALASGSLGSGDTGSRNLGSGNLGSSNTGSISSFLGEAVNATTTGATNQTTTKGNTTELLSIQTAQSGSLSQINATDYRLELNNVADKTIQFSDRPEREW
ncbi:MAG TPA: hypothetical protein VE130_16430 [Nitrososphaeraceae archaeon]|nr:hypothetical protein [Nitrososphaeraceae archaeon]